MKSHLPPSSVRAAAAASPGRRRFLSQAATATGAAALWSALGTRTWATTAGSASDAPEAPNMNFGIIALTDCSPIVIAHEKGLFKKYGINSTVTKGANWAAIRDNLSSGSIQATHMLIGMPLASTMGLAGSPKKPMVAPWLLNRNGQAITLKAAWKGKVGADPKALKPFVDQAKKLGEPLTFAMTFPPGTHAMWMRYYLAAGGIDPDKDISLITIPPPQMVANMKIGKMDGFCVGEPWNARAIADKIGFTSVTTQDMWQDHPEKVCAFTEEFAEKNPKTVKAVLKALHEASVWLDDMGNRPEQCTIVSKPTYINCDAKIIEGRLLGQLDYGDGRTVKDAFPMHFSRRNCNYPQAKYAKWFLSQYRRWGMVTGAPDYDGIAKRVMRADLYEQAMKEIGYAHGGADHAPDKFFDGAVFDPKDPEAFAKTATVKSLKG
ncbi:MAG: ABC transporter substrate-binding protein [Opitutaceae bacterium]|nr:ABC transporter substrate-binding protein [Opitutaceae bacterium]